MGVVMVVVVEVDMVMEMVRCQWWCIGELDWTQTGHLRGSRNLSADVTKYKVKRLEGPLT